MARVLLIFSLSIAATACEEEPFEPSTFATAPAPASLTSPPRRQPERWRMVRSGDRCVLEIHRAGLSIETLPDDVACPKDLTMEETIRLTGRTCFRESPDPERSVPIVCPPALVYADRDFRRAAASAAVSASTLAP